MNKNIDPRLLIGAREWAIEQSIQMSRNLDAEEVIESAKKYIEYVFSGIKDTTSTSWSEAK